MEFTREAWENAPEGARLEWNSSSEIYLTVTLIGYSTNGNPVIEVNSGDFTDVAQKDLRIILPRCKVTVQLWRTNLGRLASCISGTTIPEGWTLLDKHTFEIDGEM